MSAPPEARPTRVLVTARWTGASAEVSEMLAGSLRGAGANASFVAYGDAFAPADIVVLIGGGPEFGAIDQVVAGAGRYPTVVLWQVDPLPPPETPGETTRRAGRRAALGARVSRNRLGSWLKDRLPAASRRLARRGVDGRRSPAPFVRLDWIEQQLAAGHVEAVMVPNSASVATLARRGIGAARVPVGYHPAMGRDEGRRRDLDVVFLGRVLGGRERRLHVLASELADRGLHLRVLPRVFGDERARWLNRAKVVVNLHRDSCDWHPELLRFVLGAACGALIVSETPVPNTEPWVDGTHFVAASFADLPDIAHHYVTHDAERRALVDAATELITTDTTMDAVASRVLALVEPR